MMKDLIWTLSLGSNNRNSRGTGNAEVKLLVPEEK